MRTKSNVSLLLYGPTGAGKTTLAVGLARRAREAGAADRFILVEAEAGLKGILFRRPDALTAALGPQGLVLSLDDHKTPIRFIRAAEDALARAVADEGSRTGLIVDSLTILAERLQDQITQLLCRLNPAPRLHGAAAALRQDPDAMELLHRRQVRLQAWAETKTFLAGLASYGAALSGPVIYIAHERHIDPTAAPAGGPAWTASENAYLSPDAAPSIARTYARLVDVAALVERNGRDVRIHFDRPDFFKDRFGLFQGRNLSPKEFADAFVRLCAPSDAPSTPDPTVEAPHAVVDA